MNDAITKMENNSTIDGSQINTDKLNDTNSTSNATLTSTFEDNEIIDMDEGTEKDGSGQPEVYEVTVVSGKYTNAYDNNVTSVRKEHPAIIRVNSEPNVNPTECVIEVEAKTQKDFISLATNVHGTLRIISRQEWNANVGDELDGREKIDYLIDYDKRTATRWTDERIENNPPSSRTSNQCTENKQIAEIIFNHLQMFQYYRDLKKFDESITSLWVPHCVQIQEKDIKVEFLKHWDEKSGRGLTENWGSFEIKQPCIFCKAGTCGQEGKNGTICRHQFVQKFVKDAVGVDAEVPLEDLVCEENEQFLKNLRAVEDKWGIYINIFEEWEKTFDTLLDYYNTKDLRSTCKSIFLHNKALRKTNKLLSVHELSKWMKPQMEPSIWKKWLGQVSLKWKEHYEKEQKCYEKQYKSLTEIFKGKKNVSKKDVMCAIIEELRKGKKNKEVIVSLKNLLCRLERAEFYRLWPPRLFIVGVTMCQMSLYCYHKAYYHSFFGNENLSPTCSMYVINHDRIWQEPWRFLCYGFVHNNGTHLFNNMVCQIFFGLPLELTHGWWRVALIYLSGIFLGGLGRELTIHDHKPLAGASGGMYALVAAHVAQLILNWHNDAFVLRQRINLFGRGTSINGEEKYEPPEALPLSRIVRMLRLIVAGLYIVVTLKFDWCTNNDDNCFDTDVSHATHLYGALAGLLTGCMFLRVRSYKRPVYLFQNFLLMLVYGVSICVIIGQYYKTANDDGNICNWIEYERVCQDKCYRRPRSLVMENNLTCTVSLCNQRLSYQ